MAENQERGFCIDLMNHGEVTIMSHRNYGATNYHKAATIYEEEIGFYLEHCSIYLADIGIRMTAPGILKRHYYRVTENKV